MKKYLLLLPLILLTSCSSNMPSWMGDYFNKVRFGNAYNNIDNAKLEYNATYYATDDKGNKLDEVLGNCYTFYYLDKEDNTNYYAYLNSSYSGNFVTSYPDAAGNVIEKVNTRKCVRYAEKHDGYPYIYKTRINDEEKEKYISLDSMNVSINSFFYSEIVGTDLYIGGMYYADTLYQNRKYQSLFSMTEDGKMVYQTDRLAIFDKDDDTKITGLYSSKIVCDTLGMLESRKTEAYTVERLDEFDENGDYKYRYLTYLVEDLKITYNNQEFEKIYDI